MDPDHSERQLRDIPSSQPARAIFRSCGGGDAEIEVERTPLLETALQGWVFFVEGAILRWLERRDLGRDELRQLLQQALIGALVSASEYGAEHR